MKQTMKPKKVAISTSYGGFGLSLEAVELARKLSNNPKWGDIVLQGESYKDGTICQQLFSGYDPTVERTDPILIQVIETLGSEKASGRFARLVIETVYGKYRINEYDGAESIECPDDIQWSE